MKPNLFFMALSMVVVVGMAGAADQPQWGSAFSRNMISMEKNLPESFNPETGENIRWSVSLGSNAYATAIIAEGNVLMGANNREVRDPRHEGDRAVLLCLNEADGALRWQFVTPRIPDDRFKDWPQIGFCSPPSVENGLVYVVTNRLEVVCLDLDGQADGNDGPFLEEGRHMAPLDQPAMDIGPLDADIVWRYDLISEAGVYPHDAAHVSVLIDGPYLYLNTGNGVDNTHEVIRAPEAPCVMVLNKKTGRPVALDKEGIGPQIFHATWGAPSLGVVNNERLIFFGGPDGVCYAFAALSHEAIPATPQALKRRWRFDSDPAAPKTDVSRYLKNREESPSAIYGMPVFHKNRVYFTTSGDVWWGKREASLRCVDATKAGDITESGELWAYPLERHSMATPAIWEGLVFVTDSGGNIHCVDAETGAAYWTHNVGGEFWGSALVADGKVYAGTMEGGFAILTAEKEKRVLTEITFPDTKIASTPTAANGALYVNTLNRLYAIEKK
jgi:outer membrane protein assembly factor BamB